MYSYIPSKKKNLDVSIFCKNSAFIHANHPFSSIFLIIQFTRMDIYVICQ